MGIVSERIAAAIPGDLRSASSAQFVHAQMQVFAEVPQENPGILAFTVTVDGDLVPHHPIDVYRAGESIPVPLLIGTNRDESALFRYMKSPLMPIDLSTIRTMFERIALEQPELRVPDEHTVLAAYPRNAKRRSALRVTWLSGCRRCGSLMRTPRWRRCTCTDSTGARMFRVLRLGATHGTELNYTWGNLPAGRKDITYKLGGRATGEHIAERLLGRWGSFVREGVPDVRLDSGPTPSWPRYRSDDRRSLVIDEDDRVVQGLDDNLRDTWGNDILAFR